MRDDFRRFVSPNEIQKELLCYSDGMGFEANPDFRIERSSFQNYLVMHTISGKLWCCQNGEKIAVNSGESILLDLHDPHQYHFENKSATEIAWLHINGSPAIPVMRRIQQICSLPVKSKNPSIYGKILSLFELSDHPDPDVFQQSQQCYSILLEFLKENYQNTQGVPENSRQKEFKKAIWHVISHNLHRDITIEELAQAVSLSQYHFIRTFHDAFGVSPIQFIIKEKIRQAKYQLAYTSNTVSKISESLGFATPSYFSKVFQRVSGCSPSDYRKFGDLQDDGMTQ